MRDAEVVLCKSIYSCPLSPSSFRKRQSEVSSHCCKATTAGDRIGELASACTNNESGIRMQVGLESASCPLHLRATSA